MQILLWLGVIVVLVVLFALVGRKGRKRLYWEEGARPTVADLIAKYRELGYGEFAARLEADLRPCYHVRHADPETQCRSKLGGTPDLPENVTWPQYNGKSQAFVAQIDLSEIPRTGVGDLLPDKGTLYFFYDQDQGTWGYDPKHKGSWAVIFTESAPGETSQARFPDDVAARARYSVVPVKFEPGLSLPDFLGYAPLEALGKQDRDRVFGILEEYEGYEERTEHQLFGYPSPVQTNDMDLECQLASHGVFVGDAEGHKTPRAKELAPGAADWRLLLQVDSNTAARMTWGDWGRLYFWITDDDLRNRRFENVWMILQCT